MLACQGAVMIITLAIAVIAIIVVTLLSLHRIGPTQVGLVTLRYSTRKLRDDSPIALHGEAGYQAELLMPGMRFKLWPIFTVEKHPWVQIPAGQIGVVISQVGQPLPTGAKSAAYKNEFGQFTDLNIFIQNGG